MNKTGGTGMSLNSPPALHLGPILNPNTNETISILIPFATQVATISAQKSFKDYQKSINSEVPGTNKTISNNPRNDKTKGCPFPTCIRYGRAFSRAHDLKRHIARHEMRKEKLSDFLDKTQSLELNEKNITHQMILQRGLTQDKVETESEVASLFCLLCKKKFENEKKLKAHFVVHEKSVEKNVCALCGLHFYNDEMLQEHIKQHTINILQAQTTLTNKSDTPKESSDKDDEFLLEEMLLLHKNPRTTSDKPNSNTNKIRCDYCSKTFKTKWTLSSHVAAHEGRFQFDCGQCGKRFVRKSHYEGHVRSHEAARPYICEQCGKTFKELKHRREHTKRKHPNQNAIQHLLDSISPCGSEDTPLMDQKFTLVMPVNFTAT